jgi:hypothetical protein
MSMEKEDRVIISRASVSWRNAALIESPTRDSIKKNAT